MLPAGRGGFALAGSGSATVRTPRFYRPGQRLRVTIKGARVRRVEAIAAGHDGRLRVAVPLGPSNRDQEYTAGARTAVYTTTVRVAAA